MKGYFFTAAAALLLAGCASKSEDIAPTYVSPMSYQNHTCQQLAAEAQSVAIRAQQAAGVQDKQRSNDQVLATVGGVLFWPSLLFLNGDGQNAAELARLKGEKEAIEQASIQKQCGIQFQPQQIAPN